MRVWETLLYVTGAMRQSRRSSANAEDLFINRRTQMPPSPRQGRSEILLMSSRGQYSLSNEIALLPRTSQPALHMQIAPEAVARPAGDESWVRAGPRPSRRGAVSWTPVNHGYLPPPCLSPLTCSLG
ncbi:uncharacterized protein ACWYII_031199 isoform 1-T1 [Salvelinus alpinus]